MIGRVAAGVALVVALTVPVLAEGDKYQISAVERAACTADAMRLCRHTYPDEDQLLNCFRSNVSNLSLVCSVTFKAGLKKRGIAL